MTTFIQTEQTLTVSDIEEIEKLVKLIFPKEYKDHLLKHNGGQPVPSTFSFNENGKVSESFIDWFLAIYEGEYDNLKSYIEIYKLGEKRLPKHILPIAHDPGGNLICISCSGSDTGYVYFWDHEKEVNYKNSDDNDYTNLYLIAKSFNEFINELKE